MKMKVFSRDGFKDALDLIREPRLVFYGVRTRATQFGPEIALYVQATDGEKIVEYEETVHQGPGELKEEEYLKKEDDFKNWVFSLPAQKFLEGVVE